MKTSATDFDTADTHPASLPAALQERLLAAMQQASDEESGCREMEQLLRRMRPAALPARLTGRLGVQMYVEAQQKRRRRSYWWRVGTAAAALVLSTCSHCCPSKCTDVRLDGNLQPLVDSVRMGFRTHGASPCAPTCLEQGLRSQPVCGADLRLLRRALATKSCGEEALPHGCVHPSQRQHTSTSVELVL